jgi:20S proteasome alpha/beta subunit
MIESFLVFWAVWKFECLAVVFIAALPFLHKRYKDNILVATMIDLTTERIAQAMEADPDTNPRDKKSKADRRKKVRRDLAKSARKIQRKNK